MAYNKNTVKEVISLNKNKVSIIIPVYNGERYLKDCLDSLIHQALKEIEIIAIDDASTDHSFSILKEYSRKSSKIKIYQNLKNLGTGATRNRGLALADGEYIGFVDCDDYVSKTMYQVMYELAKENKSPDIIETKIMFVKDNCYLNQDLSYLFNKGNQLIQKKTKITELPNLSPSVCNKIFKKSFLKGKKFIENCKWEDILFTTVSGIKAKSILEVRSSDYFYRRDISRGVSSINYQPNDKILDIFKITDGIMNSVHFIQKKKYQESLEMICFAAIFKRVEELEHWNISKQKINEIKKLIYQLAYQKYGNLKNIDFNLFSAMAKEDITKEYIQLIHEQENLSQHNCKVRKKGRKN